jgi:hypothetical protein
MVKQEGARNTAEDVVPAVAGQSRTKNVAWLITLAKQAFEQNRAHNCLALTRAILLIDPENAEAHAMQAAIQSGEKPQERETAPVPVLQEEQVYLEPEAALSFTASPESPAPLESFRAVRRKLPWVPVALTLTVGILLFLLTSWLTHRQPASNAVANAAPLQNPNQALPPTPENSATTNTSVPTEPAPLPAPPTPAATAKETASTTATKPPQDLASKATPTSTPSANAAKPPVPAATGTLTITSSVPAEIFEGNRRLGSTPATLQLSAGAHQIEYRYEDLRKTVSYVIRTNETATSAISFDVTLPINARPWAQVFLDDGQRKALGQTPLTGVQVPVGGVLIFENPNFSGKTYRVTGKESAIQIIFP